jgi:hypothetical protein
MSLEHSPSRDDKGAGATVALTDAAVFVNEIEAARILNVAPRKFQYWRQNGGGPAYFKFGQAVRYRLPDLLAWADSQCRRSTAE